MNVEDIRLINFRNYKNIGIKLNKNLNIFIGNNAQGKTNLIEAIFICATGKSFRSNKDKEIISFNKEEGYVGTSINLENYSKFIEVKLHKDKPKRIRINKQELDSYKDLNSGLNVVVFTPEDLKIVKGGPSERRKFLDGGISPIKPVYNYNISKYKKVLFQRNNILRSSKFKKDRKDLKELLDVFDNQIVKIGTDIILNRCEYVKRLNCISENIHKDITNGKEVLNLKYNSNVPIGKSRQGMEDMYLNLLRKNMKRDIEFNTTEIGPHRDDITMCLDGKDARIYGSQGQQRTVILSIILSQVELLKEEKGSYPVLLLDDVFSELDESRRVFLIEFFKDIQTFITTTEESDLDSMEDINKTIFLIEDGHIK
ncbi:MAG: DNA replication/repair protein RecF [Tissierella sp.]|uniref:DNA replication/repair protein RecF n=1 Tax=Tissierella sp. TaxID=41274 RepID=UPI003F9D8266